MQRFNENLQKNEKWGEIDSVMNQEKRNIELNGSRNRREMKNNYGAFERRRKRSNHGRTPLQGSDTM
jgi:hypothetical protein